MQMKLIVSVKENAMDTTLLGSLIQAGVTCISILVAVVSIIVAVLIAKSQIQASLSQLETQMRLAGYENHLDSEMRLFETIIENENNARGFLRHFMLEGKSVPEDFEMVRMWIIVMAQISAYEKLYYRHKKGFFPEELWSQWDRSMGNSFNKDRLFREVWNSTDFKRYLWVQFTNHVDEQYFFEKRRVDEV
jgi:hypothetical protein